MKLLIMILFSIFTQRVVSSNFCYRLNNKPFAIQNSRSSYRKIVGGENQLSLSNDEFVKFVILNPVLDTIKILPNQRSPFIRFEIKGLVYKPISGSVILSKIDELNKKVSGKFEMILVNNTDTLKITEGKFTDLSLVVF